MGCCAPGKETYLVRCAAPPFKNNRGASGCETKMTKMRTTTNIGNINTTPSGTETVEFPRRRSGRWKKANLEETVLCFDPCLSSSGAEYVRDEEGSSS